MGRGYIRTIQIYDGNEFTAQDLGQSHRFNTFTLGAGFRIDVDAHLFYKFGYTYVFPQDISLFVLFAVNQTGYYKYKFTQAEQRIELAVGWKF